MNIQSQYLYPPIRNINFPIYVEKQSYTGEGEIFKSHWHEHLELLIMESGKLGLICNGAKISAQSGDLVIINPHDIHQLYSHSSFIQYYCIILDLGLLKAELCSQSDADFLIPLSNKKLIFEHKIKTTTAIQKSIEHLITEYEGNALAKEIMIKALLNQILALLVRTEHFQILDQTGFQIRNRNLSLIHKILEYLNKHYTEDIKIRDLSNLYNISYHYLSHIFKKYTNSSIIQYITELRIEKSINYLENTDKSITEIASLVGYNDSNYFSRMFKKYNSLSPRKYKKTLP